MISSAPNKLFYAIEAVLYIAYNAASGTISSRDIAARQGMPARYLEGLMQRLVRAGILRGIRGPKGGYVLAKERRRISVADICAALSEEGAENYKTTALGKNIVLPIWENAYNAWISALKEVNFAELCEQAASKQIKKMTEEKMDFTI